jgi:hypothetical protein
LKCPKIINRDEIGIVSITISNPNEKLIEPLVWTVISNPGFFTSERVRAYIQPGETQTLEWMVSEEDMVFESLILIKIYQFSAFKTPMRDGYCGILVVDLPISGNIILITMIMLSVVCMLAGVVMWVALGKIHPLEKIKITRAMIAVLGSVSLAMTFGLLGIWLLGVFIFMIMILLVGEVVRQFSAASW